MTESGKDEEQRLIRTHKEDLDKANDDGSLVRHDRIPCPCCGRSHPKVGFYWHNTATDELPGLRINLVCPSSEDLEAVFAAEKALSRIGVHFDTGYGGSRDWEFDWSLDGEHFVFNEEKKEYESIPGRGESYCSVCEDQIEYGKWPECHERDKRPKGGQQGPTIYALEREEDDE